MSLGGATQPSTSLINVPPPAPLYPSLSGQATGTLSGIMSNPGALPDVSGTVNPAFNALYNANKQFVQQGRANVAEQFGSKGLGASSPFAVASANYETQSNADFMSILADYTTQAQQLASSRQLFATGPALTTYPTKVLSTGPSALSSGESVATTLAQLALIGAMIAA